MSKDIMFYFILSSFIFFLSRKRRKEKSCQCTSWSWNNSVWEAKEKKEKFCKSQTRWCNWW